MPALTSRQVAIYAFIINFLQDHGWPPTIREISEAFDMRSPNGVVYHLKALRQKGVIDMAPYARGIRLKQYRIRLEPV